MLLRREMGTEETGRNLVMLNVLMIAIFIFISYPIKIHELFYAFFFVCKLLISELIGVAPNENMHSQGTRLVFVLE